MSFKAMELVAPGVLTLDKGTIRIKKRVFLKADAAFEKYIRLKNVDKKNGLSLLLEGNSSLTVSDTEVVPA